MSLSTALKGFREILTFDNRIQLIFHHIFCTAEKLCIYRFANYQVVILKSGGDLNGMRACVATDQYKQFFGKMLLDQPLRVLDLGAHTGGFVFVLLSEGKKISESLSVEQNFQTHSRLAFNLVLNNLNDSCKAVHAAVWSESTTLLSSAGSGRTSGKVGLGDAKDQYTQESRSISSHSLDEFVEQFDAEGVIDICKIDVEGAEWEIFSNLDSCSSLQARCRYLIIEIHPNSEFSMNLIEVIESLGFKILAKCQYGDETYLFRNKRLVR